MPRRHQEFISLRTPSACPQLRAECSSSMPVSKAWGAYQLFRKLSRAFQEPDLSETYDSDTIIRLTLSCLNSSKPHPASYCSAERLARQNRSDHQERCARHMRGNRQTSTRRFSARHRNLEPNESRHLQRRIGSGNDDPYESVNGFFLGSKLLFSGPLTYGWSKTANPVQGFNKKPLSGS